MRRQGRVWGISASVPVVMVMVVEVTVMVMVMATVVATMVRIVEAEAVDFARTNTRGGFWKKTAGARDFRLD